VSSERDTLGVALLSGEDDEFLHPIDKIIGGFAILVVADRAKGELVAAGIDAGEQCRKTADGLVLDLDAEHLAECFGQIGAGAGHDGAGHDLVGRE
jgi:hypothetical protein